MVVIVVVDGGVAAVVAVRSPMQTKSSGWNGACETVSTSVLLMVLDPVMVVTSSSDIMPSWEGEIAGGTKTMPLSSRDWGRESTFDSLWGCGEDCLTAVDCRTRSSMVDG